MRTMAGKKISYIAAAAIAASVLTACGNTDSGASSDNTSAADSGAFSDEITVISREDGSGTRGAFVELTGVEEKNTDGNKVDRTTEEAVIANSTDVVITQVSGNKNAIGYISLGSLNNTVKALKADDAEPTVENIKSGSYRIARPFNIAVKEGLSTQAQDFIDFIMSTEGQKIVEENKYIPKDMTESYCGSSSGKITVAGSSSVTPVMEKLAEAYKELNPDTVIEVQQSDSTSGMKAVSDGTCDIGMASRALNDSELENGLIPTVIAMDGIAVIVNNENTCENVTTDQIKAIFTGEITDWSDIG